MIRDFFYIGGEYVYEPAYNSSIYSNQMYVEKLMPVHGANETYPIILMSAGIPSGAVCNAMPSSWLKIIHADLSSL